jgi:hypothetical protein
MAPEKYRRNEKRSGCPLQWPTVQMKIVPGKSRGKCNCRSVTVRRYPPRRKTGFIYLETTNYLLSPLTRPLQKVSHSAVGNAATGYESINYLPRFQFPNEGNTTAVELRVCEHGQEKERRRRRHKSRERLMNYPSEPLSLSLSLSLSQCEHFLRASRKKRRKKKERKAITRADRDVAAHLLEY